MASSLTQTSDQSASTDNGRSDSAKLTENGIRNRGVLLGALSAVGYSAANLSLRGLSGRDESLSWAVWVTAMKALPTVVLSVYLLLRRWRRAEPFYPTRRPIPALVAAAFVMQFGGNLGFQIALIHVGLAITVPLVFAFIICTGAALGRIFLGDGVSFRTVVAMAIMTVAIMLLSWAATLNATQQTSAHVVAWFGVLMAIVSGLSYGVNGVVIRRVSRDLLPIESMLIIYSTTGLISLTAIGMVLLGPDRIAAITTAEWSMMLAAGICNAFAFFCITNALKLMNISQVNVINASQNAMCAMAAVLIFGEAVSTPLVVGIALSICGLFVLDRKS